MTAKLIPTDTKVDPEKRFRRKSGLNILVGLFIVILIVFLGAFTGQFFMKPTVKILETPSQISLSVVLDNEDFNITPRITVGGKYTIEKDSQVNWNLLVSSSESFDQLVSQIPADGLSKAQIETAIKKSLQTGTLDLRKK